MYQKKKRRKFLLLKYQNYKEILEVVIDATTKATLDLSNLVIAEDSNNKQVSTTLFTLLIET